jgi:hypothetical protein
MSEVYVSMTGFRPAGLLRLPAFLWRTWRSLSQARRASGNLGVKARVVGGTYHTMTIWTNEASMRRFVQTGAHLSAMRNFRLLGSGKTFGYRCDVAPDWNALYRLWCSKAKEV